MTGLELDRGDVTGAVRTPNRRLLAALRRTMLMSLLALGVTAGSYGAYCGVMIYEGNFHAVRPGVFYRSAQLNRSEFDSFAREYGIKSVLNLRGAHAGEAWYDREMAAMRDLGIVHYDFPISAKRFVTAPEVARIIAILREAPKPLLIHCKSGADRAGLVSALYQYAIAGATATDADRQLSLVYGHFPYLTSRSGAMDDSFWAYVHRAAHPASG